MAACRKAWASASGQLERVDWASSSISGDGVSTQGYVSVQRSAGARCPPSIRMMANPRGEGAVCVACGGGQERPLEGTV